MPVCASAWWYLSRRCLIHEKRPGSAGSIDSSTGEKEAKQRLFAKQGVDVKPVPMDRLVDTSFLMGVQAAHKR